MESSAFLSSRLIPQHAAISIRSTSICSAFITFRSPTLLSTFQQRSLFWWGLHRDPEWRSQAYSRLQRLMEKEKEIRSFYNRYLTHAMRRRPYLYQSRRINKCRGPDLTSRFQNRREVYEEISKATVRGAAEPEHPRVANEQWSKKWFEEDGSAGEEEDFESWDGKEREYGEFMRRDSKQQFREFKRAIDSDTYGAILGRRLEHFPFGLKEGSWLSFCRSFTDNGNHRGRNPSSSSFEVSRKPTIDETANSETTPRKVTVDKGPSPSTSTLTDAAFEFDPISGKMATRQSKTSDHQANDSSTVIYANPRDGEAELGTDNETINSESAQNLDSKGRTIESNGPDTLDVWSVGKPDQVVCNNIATLRPEKEDAATTEENGLSSVDNSQTDKTPVEHSAANYQLYRESLAKLMKALPKDEAQHNTRESEKKTGQNPSSGNMRNDKPSSESPVCEIYRNSFNFRNASQPEAGLDQLRASDIHASFEPREGSQYEAATASQTLQDAGCGLDVDELRWKLRPENNKSANIANSTDTAAILMPAIDRIPKGVNSQLNNDDGRGEKNGKIIYNHDIGDRADITVTASSSENDKIHPVFGVSSSKAKLHSQIGNIAKELRKVKEKTNSMSAFLTEKRAQYEIATSSMSQGDNGDVPVPSEEMKTSMEECLKQLATIGETLTEVKNINTSINSVLRELGENMQGMRCISDRANKKPTRELPQTKGKISSPSQYRVLAYDSLTMEVKDIGISSGHSGSGDITQQLHPTEALSRLNNPSRFLEHFPRLEGQGYEIVSGGGDILIFKKVRESSGNAAGFGIPDTPEVVMGKKTDGRDEAMLHSEAQAAKLERQSIDQFDSGCLTAEVPASSSFSPSKMNQEPSFQSVIIDPETSTSPHGQQNQSPSSHPKDSEQQKQQQEGKQDSSTPPPPNNEKQTHFLRKAMRGILLTGGVAAGTCYALGVVVEYFRTGGHDGLGPQGFTGLEGR
ncbi:hypothetical protein PAAG_08391 [Paracoccidioides lutzii Pb01]|uniref:Uncharacterized protein n=1 Tax=Paracoccidioides lutzii (strain ATCC MYA-826 / Pb01) TaxID=502779 RepID=C1HCA0_PARBA|nr:hypothetical protein PAAG_08391 [Paracoccidioides lutzii Pb01]EEH38664.1 hypothetical protein PAAG_08391 [Paracoccidioides lutzii Pb01]